jgi:hypothetical protein
VDARTVLQSSQRSNPAIAKPATASRSDLRALRGADGQPLDASMSSAAYALIDVVHAVVNELRAQLEAEPRAAYVDDRGAAQALDTSVQTMVRLAREGAPHLIIGEGRRWDMARLATWLEARPQGASK